ncbi:MAG: hypothetical protein ACRDT4_13290 [Micromonosporaceae bacterium]
MARFVPRTLREQRVESDAEDRESKAVTDGDAPTRKPSPRRNGSQVDGPTSDDSAAVGDEATSDDAAAVGDEPAEAAPARARRRPGPRPSKAAPSDIEADAPDADAEPADEAVDGVEEPSGGASDQKTGSESEAAPDKPARARSTRDKAGSAKPDRDKTSKADRDKTADRDKASGDKAGVADRDKPRRAATKTAERVGGRPKKKVDAEAGRDRAGGRKVVTAPRTGSNRRAKLAQAAIGRLQRTAVSLLVWLVVFGAIAGVAGYFHQQGAATDKAGRDAMTAARSAAEAIFSYDYRSFDESVANGKQHVTGKFKDNYAKTTAGLAKTAQKEQAIMRAKVAAEASVVEASPTRVDVLLFVNQYRRNANIQGEKLDQNRVVLTMVYVEEGSGPGIWLVSDAVAL